MTKTKRQLRAEAVERLKCMDEWCEEPKTAADFMKGLLWDLRVIDSESVRDALVDLLADEPPEGDAPSEFSEILMELAAGCSCMGDGIVRHFEPRDVQNEVDALMRVVERDYVRRGEHEELPEGDPVRIPRDASGSDVSNLLLINTTSSNDVEEAYDKLADMVERDYVWREAYDDLESANERQALKIHNVCELNEKLTVERDEWKAKAERTCNDTNEEEHDFTCSECGASMYTQVDDCWIMIARGGLCGDIIERPNYCPNCGARVVGE